MIDWTKHWGNPEPVEAVKAWGIYANFDGNAPDSYNFVYCSTYELATASVELLHEWDTFKDGEVVGPDGERWEICIPSCEGWEFSKSFHIVECIAERHTVSCTIAEVLLAIMQ